MSLPPLLASILGWLRAGYPNGVPEQDYVPLMALLRRQLSDAEIAALAEDLVAQFPDPTDSVDIGVLITKVTDDMPHETDVARVRTHLIRGGWEIDESAPQPNDSQPPSGEA